VPPITASFYSKVGIFTPLRLNNYHVRIAKLIGFGHGAAVRRPELKSDANVIVIEITSHFVFETAKKSGAVIGGATLPPAAPLSPQAPCAALTTVTRDTVSNAY
jgi:hypothetical protein